MRTELSSSRLVVGLGSHAPSRCGGEDHPPAVTSPGLCSCSCSGSLSAVPTMEWWRPGFLPLLVLLVPVEANEASTFLLESRS